MKVLIIGNGGREHALVWKFAKSHRIHGLYVCPGNGGTEGIAKNVNINPDDHDKLISFVESENINLVFVGPEAPLSKGIVDSLSKAGIDIIGPNKYCAQLESSKAFSKDFLVRNNLPTASAKTFTSKPEFSDYIKSNKGMVVVKKSGLAAGKGVLESDNTQELLDFGLPFLDNDSVVVEEYLRGFEVSFFTLSDGKSYVILPPATDYKKALEGNLGPNTGGMGAISPVPWLEKSMVDRIETEIIEPVFAALKKDNLMYKGLLYFGLMITKTEPKILEFNVRFGDPEAQVVIPRIENDFCDLMEAVAQERLDEIDLVIKPEAALGVVIASKGYPGDYPTGCKISLHEVHPNKDQLLFHAGTKIDSGSLATSGGRVFACVGFGKDLSTAREQALGLAQKVSFDGSWFRRDIGSNIYNQDIG